MLAERWRQIETLYHFASALEPERRRAYIEGACGGDETLRCEVESLLASGESAADFLESKDSDSPPKATRTELPSGERIGPYVVLEFLRAGGMGEVYKALDTRLERTVAIKFLPVAFAAERQALDRFQREARAASALNHPRICTIYDVGWHQGRPFFVMEFLEGQSLSERLSGGPLALSELLDFGVQIADALGAAHAKGIVHRDVKPANLFVTTSGQVKILDFGLAKRAPEPPLAATVPARTQDVRTPAADDGVTLTHPGDILGTVAYLSPEQASGGDVDTRTDIYSLGVVLYEMATGRPVFRGETTADLLDSILTETPVRPSALNPNVLADLDRVVLKAIEKNRQARFQTMGELQADLRTLQQPKARRLWTSPVLLVFLTALVAASLIGNLASRWETGRVPARIQGSTGGAATQAIHSIAVLPFKNLSGDQQQNYFVDGLTGLLTEELAKTLRVRVTSRSSAMRYADTDRPLPAVARELNVSAVVKGAVTRSGNRLRVAVQLIDGPSARQLWAETYDRDLVDILTLQIEIARAVAHEIGTAMAGGDLRRATPVNPEAFEDYLRARYYLDQRTGVEITKAVSWFQKAIDADPAYAAAYAGLADCYNQLGTVMVGSESPSESRKLAKAAASRALVIDPSLAEAHAALAYSNLYDWNWTLAEQGFERAIALNPNYAPAHLWFAHYLTARGEFDRGQQEVRLAADLDPLSPIIQTQVGWLLAHSKHFGEAIAQYRKVLAQYPNYQWALWQLGNALSDAGDDAAAIRVLEQAVQLGRTSVLLGSLGMSYARAGRKREAEKLLAELLALSRRGYVPPHAIMRIYLGLGDRDKVFEWMERSYQERSNSLLWLGASGRLFDPVRSDPRFEMYLHKVGLK